MDREIALKWSSLTGKKKKDKTPVLSRIMKILLSSTPSIGARNAPLELLVCDLRNDFLLLLSAPYPSHAHGSAQSLRTRRDFQRRENKVHAPKDGGF